MGILMKCTPEVCRTCIYRGTFGSETRADAPTPYSLCCNFWEIEGHSRRSDGKGHWQAMAFSNYCDKYEKGERVKPKNTYNPNTRPENEQFYVGRDGRLHVRDGYRKE